MVCCWLVRIGVRREGRRKVGGVCCPLLDCKSLRTAGRKAVGVDIVGGGAQWRVDIILFLCHQNTKSLEMQLSRESYSGHRTTLA